MTNKKNEPPWPTYSNQTEWVNKTLSNMSTSKFKEIYEAKQKEAKVAKKRYEDFFYVNVIMMITFAMISNLIMAFGLSAIVKSKWIHIYKIISICLILLIVNYFGKYTQINI